MYSQVRLTVDFLCVKGMLQSILDGIQNAIVPDVMCQNNVPTFLALKWNWQIYFPAHLQRNRICRWPDVFFPSAWLKKNHLGKRLPPSLVPVPCTTNFSGLAHTSFIPRLCHCRSLITCSVEMQRMGDVVICVIRQTEGRHTGIVERLGCPTVSSLHFMSTYPNVLNMTSSN